MQFYKLLHEHTGYSYHPFVTIMCESLASDERYTIKHLAYFEPGHYFCWVDYELEPLRLFLEELAQRYLADEEDAGSQEIPS